MNHIVINVIDANSGGEIPRVCHKDDIRNVQEVFLKSPIGLVNKTVVTYWNGTVDYSDEKVNDIYEKIKRLQS